MGRPSVVVILVAAGAGRRLGGSHAKAFRTIGGRPILSLAASAATAERGVAAVVAVVPAGGEDAARAVLEHVVVPLEIVPGGVTRQASVRAGLAATGDDAGIVVVHDAARPFASAALFDRVVDAVSGTVDAAVPALPVGDTVLRVRDGEVIGVEPRDELALAQTPQAFRAAVLREAHAKADAAGASFTDDGTLARWAGFEVRTVEGEIANVKITTAADLAEAERRAGGRGA